MKNCFIEKKPKTYRSRVHWYVSHWKSNRIELFSTKAKAIARLVEWRKYKDDDIFCIGWFPLDAKPQFAISRIAHIVDYR